MIKRLKKLLNEARPGKWKVEYQYDIVCEDNIIANCDQDIGEDCFFDFENRDNAELIVLSHNMLPILLEIAELAKFDFEAICGMCVFNGDCDTCNIPKLKQALARLEEEDDDV